MGRVGRKWTVNNSGAPALDEGKGGVRLAVLQARGAATDHVRPAKNYIQDLCQMSFSSGADGRQNVTLEMLPGHPSSPRAVACGKRKMEEGNLTLIQSPPQSRTACARNGQVGGRPEQRHHLLLVLPHLLQAFLCPFNCHMGPANTFGRRVSWYGGRKETRKKRASSIW